MTGKAWRVSIDTGGTFTDCVAVSDDGEVRRRKVLSSGRLRARLLAASSESELFIDPIEGVGSGFLTGFQGDVVGWGQGTVQRHETVQPHETVQRTTAEGAGGNDSKRDAERDSERKAEKHVENSGHPGSRLLMEPSCWQPHEVRSGSAFPGTEFGWVELWNGLEAPMLGLHLLFSVVPGAPLPQIDLRLGTTKGTNALLERKGARCVFVVTRGFGDLIEIGDQSRPELFSREIVKPRPLYSAVIEVDERLAAGGEIVRPLGDGEVTSVRLLEQRPNRGDSEDCLPDEEIPLGDLSSVLGALAVRGFESVAVAFLHSYAHPGHEQQVGAMVRGVRGDGLPTSLSYRLSGLAGFLARAQTTVVDAYLAPLMNEYLGGIEGNLRSRFQVMTSAGGLISNQQFCAKDSLLSGPAGGVVGCAQACALAGVSTALAFDMGGTSTDVSRYCGDLEYDPQHQVAGATVVAPALAIRTVAAGGGSVCMVRNGRLQVGPESAGAEPGPACYGRGGPLTVTDVNLLLGRIDGARFEVPLDLLAAREALHAVKMKLADITAEELLEGFLAVANERMAETIRKISTRRGYDPRDHTLVAFGGAGGQHACGLAESLDINKVLVPEDCSLLSARGIAAAHLERFVQRQALMAPDQPAFESLVAEIAGDAKRQVEAEFLEPIARVSGKNETGSAYEVRLDTAAKVRYQGQDSGIEVQAFPLETLGRRFEARYRAIFGYTVDRSIEVEWLRTRARLISVTGNTALVHTQRRTSDSRCDGAAVLVWDGSKRTAVPLVPRSNVPLAGAQMLNGPIMVTEEFSSTWVPPGWSAFIESAGFGLVLQRTRPPSFQK